MLGEPGTVCENRTEKNITVDATFQRPCAHSKKGYKENTFNAVEIGKSLKNLNKNRCTTR